MRQRHENDGGSSGNDSDKGDMSVHDAGKKKRATCS